MTDTNAKLLPNFSNAFTVLFLHGQTICITLLSHLKYNFGEKEPKAVTPKAPKMFIGKITDCKVLSDVPSATKLRAK